jgi:hypothetical protein
VLLTYIHPWKLEFRKTKKLESLICHGEYITCDDSDDSDDDNDGVDTLPSNLATLLNDPVPNELELNQPIHGNNQETNSSVPSSSFLSSWQPKAWVVKYPDSSNAYGILFIPNKQVV